MASHPQRRIQFHPDSEEWGGGGEPSRVAGHPGWCLGEKGPQILHCSGVQSCFGCWHNAIRDQPQADHILKTWLPPRSPGSPLRRQRHSFCRSWKGLTGLLNPLWRPIRPNPFPTLRMGFMETCLRMQTLLAHPGGSWDFQVVLDPWEHWRKSTEAQDGLCRKQNCFSVDLLEPNGVCI